MAAPALGNFVCQPQFAARQKYGPPFSKGPRLAIAGCPTLSDTVGQHVGAFSGMVRVHLPHFVEAQEGITVCRRDPFETVWGDAPRF